ncbi:MAG: hypothetical protein A2V65_02445 [Deltaproteobacteria bacterium RBG_13_49_15]|nr:MAG: hypothetical protein A2V65_02445 [Deltaproteobacteria bacterium RBG_13_49_15]
MERIWACDHTVWKDDPEEITNRLGWLQSPEKMRDNLDNITAFVETARRMDFRRALLLGMGGSSLAPEVFRAIFGKKAGYPDLNVIDTTHPDVIIDWTHRVRNEKTLFIVSTKSGATVETLSLMKHFYNLLLNDQGKEAAGSHFIAITDPESPLTKEADRLGFLKVFKADPEIGGRYSVISHFGLVPAALIGMNPELILEKARTMIRNGEKTALHLGVSMGELALSGKDKLTLILSRKIEPFSAWVEQLIAESTGKEGKGIVPVTGEIVGPPQVYDNDRLFVHVRLKNDRSQDDMMDTLVKAGYPLIRINIDEPYDLCGEFLRWEMATAVAGAHMRINPFDQPNVESAKRAAKQILRAYREKGVFPESQPDSESGGVLIHSPYGGGSLKDVFKRFFSFIQPGKDKNSYRSYVSIQAYIKPDSKTDKALQAFRQRIRNRFHVAVTIGYGPRFLHSTGQLHKGDAGHGLFIQLTSEVKQDLPIPDKAGESGSGVTFGILKSAQALGDRQALIDAGRKVIRFHLKTDISEAMEQMTRALPIIKQGG